MLIKKIKEKGLNLDSWHTSLTFILVLKSGNIKNNNNLEWVWYENKNKRENFIN